MLVVLPTGITDLRLWVIENSIIVGKCWIWTGGLGGPGYGHVRMPGAGGSWEYAHRVSWMAFNGPIPVGMYCLHKCDVKMCVHPKHLYIGTQSDNMYDTWERNREAYIPKPRPLSTEEFPSWRRI